MTRPLTLVVLLSGRGSNFLAIHDAIARGELDAKVAAVISNRPDAPGLKRASELGCATFAVDHRAFANRQAHEAEVIRVIDGAHPDLIILAGYMRLLSADFVQRYHHRILNIHPSLLPAFPGVDAQAQALAHGVRVSGCTVHLVDETLDGGPILVQKTVEVLDGDDEELLSHRILEQEHVAYVEAIRKLAGGFRVEGRRVIFDAPPVKISG